MTEIPAMSPLGVIITLLMIVVPILLAFMISNFILWYYEGDHCLWYGMLDGWDAMIDWVKSGGKRRKRRPLGAAPPQQPVPPSTGGADGSIAGQIASGLGKDEAKPVVERIRHALPIAFEGDHFPRIECRREADRITIRVFSKKHCILRASFPNKTDGGNHDGNQTRVYHFDPTNETVGCSIDGIDLTFHEQLGKPGCIYLNFDPDKAHAQAHDIASQGQHKAGNPEQSSYEGNDGRDPQSEIGKVHDADHTKQPLAGCDDGLADAHGHKD